MKNAVLYVRVSSDDQREGLSIEAQVRLLEKYAKENNIKIIKKFIATESAKAPGRKVFGEMISYVKKYEIPIILVEKTDRLYRNTRDYVTILELSVKIHLVSENQVLDDDDFNGMFMHEIQVALAKRFIGNLRRESLKGMREKAIRGHYPGRAPIGYLNDKEKKIIVVDKTRIRFIKKIFQLYCTGEYSLKRLADVMDSEGFKGRMSSRITKRAIETILQNPFYIGQFIFEGKKYKGKHTPLISISLFDEAQAQLKNRGKPITKGKYYFPFKGIAKCGYCGCNLTAEIKKKRYVYYRCTQARGKCKLNYFREEKLAEIFKESIEKLHLTDEVLEWLLEAIRESTKEKFEYINNALHQLRIEYSQNELKKEQIYEDRLSERFNEDFLEEQFDKIELRQLVILEDIKLYKSQILCPNENEEKILELVKNLRNQYDTMDFAKRGKLLKILLSNSTIYNETCLFSYRKPFDAIAEFAKMEIGSATGIRTPV